MMIYEYQSSPVSIAESNFGFTLFVVGIVTIIFIYQKRKDGQSNNIFIRPKLTRKPVFDLIVGNHVSVQTSIEQSIFRTKDGEKRKENLPFLCIINPPRYGKSLLLDRILVDEKSILTIPITYNATTSFSQNEITSVETATRYFWLRVFLVISNCSIDSFVDAYKMYGHKLSSFGELRALIKELGACNPFHKTQDLVIVVDEFSTLTDAAEKSWTKAEKHEFITHFQNWKSTKPLRQLVFSGFNKGMTKFLVSGSIIEPFSLSHCSFRESRPLLQKIYDSYVGSNKEKDFPLLIYESIKSMPGMIGQWAEFIHDHKLFCTSMENFVEKVNWLKYLVEEDKDIQKYFELIMKYLVYEEYNCPLKPEFQTELVVHGLAIPGVDSEAIELSPICFTVLSYYFHKRFLRSRSPKKNDSDLFLLNYQIKKALDIISDYNMISKEGCYFESYVETCLHLRFLIRQYQISTEVIQMEDPSQRNQLLLSVNDLFPTNKIFNCLLNGISFQLHLLVEKDELKKFMFSSLYYLFPVGVSSLLSKDAMNSGSTKSAILIENMREEKIISDTQEFIPNELLVVHYSRPFTPEKNAITFVVGENTELWNTQCAKYLQKFKEVISALDEDNLAPKQWEKKNGLKDTMKDFIQDSKVHRYLIENTKKLLDFIESDSLPSSIIPLANSESKPAEGLDILLVTPVNASERKGYHFFAVELKDRRDCSDAEMKKKIVALCSSRCIFGLIQAYFEKKNISCYYHIVIAGREHSIAY